MEGSFNFPEKQMIIVRINGIEYDLNVFFSMRDSGIAMAIKEAASPDYGLTLCEIIKEHLQFNEKDAPSIESIRESEALDLYIDAVLVDSDEIREKYDSYAEIVDRVERFITAANDNTREEMYKLRESLKQIKIPSIELPQIATSALPKLEIPKQLFDYSSILPDIKVISQAIATIIKPAFDVGAIAKVYQDSIRTIIGTQQSLFKDIANQIAKTIPKISSLSMSEERIEEIRETQRVWGSYGWTIPEHAEIRDVFNLPASKAEADKIAMKYCSSKHMEALFEDTKRLQRTRLNDFEEAVANYRDRRYRSCALLLFSLIDARLIRMQRDDDRKRGFRLSGKKAAQTILKHYKDEQLHESMYFSIFRYENLYACLMKVFEDGDDFKKQPDIINRNFLNHGMLVTRVRKRDCIQLFLLYYNWLSFLEKVES